MVQRLQYLYLRLEALPILDLRSLDSFNSTALSVFPVDGSRDLAIGTFTESLIKEYMSIDDSQLNLITYLLLTPVDSVNRSFILQNKRLLVQNQALAVSRSINHRNEVFE